MLPAMCRKFGTARNHVYSQTHSFFYLEIHFVYIHKSSHVEKMLVFSFISFFPLRQYYFSYFLLLSRLHCTVYDHVLFFVLTGNETARQPKKHLWLLKT